MTPALPAEMTAPGALITFRHLGFENFDFQVLAVMAGRMGVAAILGGIIAYRFWRRFMPWHFEPPESGAQVLIAVAGGLMTAVIGNNVALAFALVGLGGFIRFRSGIKDPREAGVMFLMIGIGMACGIGAMPVAITAAIVGLALLAILDVVESRRRRMARRRFRFSGVENPRQLEPKIRGVLSAVASIRGSKIALRRDEVVVDVYGDTMDSAGAVIELLADSGIELTGDVSCEEI